MTAGAGNRSNGVQLYTQQSFVFLDGKEGWHNNQLFLDGMCWGCSGVGGAVWLRSFQSEGVFGRLGGGSWIKIWMILWKRVKSYHPIKERHPFFFYTTPTGNADTFLKTEPVLDYSNDIGLGQTHLPSSQHCYYQHHPNWKWCHLISFHPISSIIFLNEHPPHKEDTFSMTAGAGNRSNGVQLYTQQSMVFFSGGGWHNNQFFLDFGWYVLRM